MTKLGKDIHHNWLNVIRRIQSVSRSRNVTNCAIVSVNVVINDRGEPIICTPEDAYRCFMRTEMDILVIEDFLMYKEEQPEWKEKGDWRSELELD